MANRLFIPNLEVLDHADLPPEELEQVRRAVDRMTLILNALSRPGLLLALRALGLQLLKDAEKFELEAVYDEVQGEPEENGLLESSEEEDADNAAQLMAIIQPTNKDLLSMKKLYMAAIKRGLADGNPQIVRIVRDMIDMAAAREQLKATKIIVTPHTVPDEMSERVSQQIEYIRRIAEEDVIGAERN
jgi:hypothetical protein